MFHFLFPHGRNSLFSEHRMVRFAEGAEAPRPFIPNPEQAKNLQEFAVNAATGRIVEAGQRAADLRSKLPNIPVQPAQDPEQLAREQKMDQAIKASLDAFNIPEDKQKQLAPVMKQTLLKDPETSIVILQDLMKNIVLLSGKDRELIYKALGKPIDQKTQDMLNKDLSGPGKAVLAALNGPLKPYFDAALPIIREQSERTISPEEEKAIVEKAKITIAEYNKALEGLKAMNPPLPTDKFEQQRTYLREATLGKLQMSGIDVTNEEGVLSGKDQEKNLKVLQGKNWEVMINKLMGMVRFFGSFAEKYGMKKKTETASSAPAAAPNKPAENPAKMRGLEKLIAAKANKMVGEKAEPATSADANGTVYKLDGYAAQFRFDANQQQWQWKNNGEDDGKWTAISVNNLYTQGTDAAKKLNSLALDVAGLTETINGVMKNGVALLKDQKATGAGRVIDDATFAEGVAYVIPKIGQFRFTNYQWQWAGEGKNDWAAISKMRPEATDQDKAANAFARKMAGGIMPAAPK